MLNNAPKPSNNRHTLLNHPIVHLTPPTISEAHIDEKIVCIRAHRERIFQVTTQMRQGKLIVHNYGQGGAGWTFLFGCVGESLRQFSEQLTLQPHLKKQPITVIGAGCYGLLTAIELARLGHEVRIVAAETEALPSSKAAGFFFPRPRKSSTQAETAQFLAAGFESFHTYLSIINGSHPFMKAGPTIIPCYYGLEIDPQLLPYIQEGLIASPTPVKVDFGTGRRYDMMEYQTLFINATHMMAELHRNIAALKIPISKTLITDFDEIPEAIIFNCTSLGAQQLTDDPRMVPVQGHLITLKDQPPSEQLQYMINARVTVTLPNGRPRDELVYYAPKGNGILGITFLRGQSSLTANQHEFDRLIERSSNFFGTR